MEVDDVLDALCAPVRRLMLDELVARDGQTLFELCIRLIDGHGLPLTRQAIGQHLSVLEKAGLAHTTKRGKFRSIHVDTSALASIGERWPIPNRSGGTR